MMKLIGSGRTADVYDCGDETVVKLFKSGFSDRWISNEALIGTAVYEAGISAPKVFGLVEADGRTGIQYERIEGQTLLQHMRQEPWKVRQFAREMAVLHADIHTGHTKNLQSQYELLSSRIKAAKIDEISKTRALEYLQTLPKGDSVCHGDFHPDNIILSPKGKVVIDWTNACSGNPLGDVARTCLMIRSPYSLPTKSPFSKHLLRIVNQVILRAYLKEYLKRTGTSKEKIDAWIYPVAAARLREGIPGEEQWLRRIINKSSREFTKGK